MQHPFLSDQLICKNLDDETRAEPDEVPAAHNMHAQVPTERKTTY
jgi:hypothetical protein